MAASAASIAIAPIAAAAPASFPADVGNASSAASASGAQSCIVLGGTQSQCQSPGNVQINDSPPQVDYYPYAGGAT
ncbi:hypothetical protein [Mycobacterium aquaticum]|uniref:hypothetical protein n=1 Tax=Mycobacterium aquaticum TaxID=1927124 RepID=UPI001FE540FF|nr:hypothetical protein [Mycobacterium aquaticum]